MEVTGKKKKRKIEEQLLFGSTPTATPLDKETLLALNTHSNTATGSVIANAHNVEPPEKIQKVATFKRGK